VQRERNKKQKQNLVESLKEADTKEMKK